MGWRGSRRLAITLVTFLLGPGLCAGPALAERPVSVFVPPRIVMNDSGGVTVAWLQNDVHRTLRVASAASGGPFESPVALSDPEHTAFTFAMGIDRAGDVVVVWEETTADDPLAYNNHSLGVFASVRLAQGNFGPPVRLSGPQDSFVNPRLALSANGHGVVTITGGRSTTLMRWSPQAGFWPAESIDGYHVGQPVGIDDAGTVTLAETSPLHLEIRAWTVPENGVVSGPQSVGTTGYWRSVLLAVGATGQAVLVAGGDRALDVSLRSTAQGSFGPLMPLARSDDAETRPGPDGAAIDSVGQATVVWTESGTLATRVMSASARSGSFASPIVLSRSRPVLDAGLASLAVDEEGDRAVAWFHGIRDLGVAYQATSNDAGRTFSTSGSLSTFPTAQRQPDIAVNRTAGTATVFDETRGANELLLVAWRSRSGSEHQAVVTSAPTEPLRPEILMVNPSSQTAIADKRGRIAVTFSCLLQMCQGDIVLHEGRSARGASLGSATFSLRFANSLARLRIRLATRALHALRRGHMLRATAVVHGHVGSRKPLLARGNLNLRAKKRRQPPR